MVKPEWGIKRTCNGCGVRFYDLNKTPIVCPKCSTPYEMVTPGRGRKSRVSAEKNLPVEDLILADDLELPEDGDLADALIEDADDLDEGLDDVADVLDRGEDDDR